MKKTFDKRSGRVVGTYEEGGAGAKPPQRPDPRRATGLAMLAACIWDLHSFLVARSTDANELQVLGEFWDEHKHSLEDILRKGH